MCSSSASQRQDKQTTIHPGQAIILWTTPAGSRARSMSSLIIPASLTSHVTQVIEKKLMDGSL